MGIVVVDDGGGGGGGGGLDTKDDELTATMQNIIIMYRYI